MKRILLALLFAAAFAQAQTVQEVYAEGVRAYSGGDFGLAKAKFAEVLATNPNHEGARRFLYQIQMSENKSGSLLEELREMTIPEISVKDASLSSVVEYLRQAAERAGGKKLNIVELYPADFGSSTLVSLSLNGVPMSEVLNYVAEAAGIRVEYQAHAVVLRPPAP